MNSNDVEISASTGLKKESREVSLFVISLPRTKENLAGARRGKEERKEGEGKEGRKEGGKKGKGREEIKKPSS